MVGEKERSYTNWRRETVPDIALRITRGHALILTFQCNAQPDHFIRFVRKAETYNERLGVLNSSAALNSWVTSEQAYPFKQVNFLGWKFNIPQGGVSKDIWVV